MIDNRPDGHPTDEHGKYLFYHFGGFFVHKQRVFVVRVFDIAVGSVRTDKFPVALFIVEHLPDLLACLIAVLIVHDVGDRHNDVGNAVRVFVAVHALGQTDKPHIHLYKEIFNQRPRIGVVSGQAGQVFDNDAVDFPCVNIGQQPLKVFPVGVRPGAAVVDILFRAFKFIDMPVIVILQQPPLIDNAVAIVALFGFLRVLFGKADIFTQSPVQYVIWCLGNGLICSPICCSCHVSSFLSHYTCIIPRRCHANKVVGTAEILSCGTSGLIGAKPQCDFGSTWLEVALLCRAFISITSALRGEKFIIRSFAGQESPS